MILLIGEHTIQRLVVSQIFVLVKKKQESPANAKGTCDSSACMKAHCKQM